MSTNKTGKTRLCLKLASSSGQNLGRGRSIPKASKSGLEKQQTCKTSLSSNKICIDETDNKKISSTDLGIEQKTGESSLKHTKHELQKTSLTGLKVHNKSSSSSSSSYKTVSIPSSSIPSDKIRSTNLVTKHQEKCQTIPLHSSPNSKNHYSLLPIPNQISKFNSSNHLSTKTEDTFQSIRGHINQRHHQFNRCILIYHIHSMAG